MNEPSSRMPKVAVITRTKDRPVLLRRAMASVLGQTCQDWIHVIINDGGNPAVVDLLGAEYEAPYHGRLTILHNPRSTGMQNASNRAIRESSSECVTIHDDDDTWEPRFLERCVEHLDRSGMDSSVQGVTTHATWIIEEINANGEIVELSRQDYFPKETISLMEMAGENQYPPITFLYRRRVHEQVGYFNEAFSVMGDWEFNLRFLARYDIDVIPEKLAGYHWRTQGAGTAYGNTVTSGLAVHKEMRTRLMNHYMRQDLDAGRPGFGHLMNVSRQIVELSLRVDELKGQADRTSVKIGTTLSHVEHLSRITRDLARLWEVKDSVARRVAAARIRRGAVVDDAPSPAARDVVADVERFVAGVPADGVLSIDVFDTALLRLVRQPVDVFALLEPDVRQLLGKPDLPFAQARVTAERIARSRHAGSGREDVTLAEIHEVLAELAGITPADTHRLQDMEIETEKRLCYANPIILRACSTARARGVRVVFVSDMYLPVDVVRALLVEKGFEASDVFVSSAEGKAKYSGALFARVLERLGCPADRVYHIGDNAHSDHRRPLESGMQALHVDRSEWGGHPLADQHTALTGEGDPSALSSLFTGLCRRRSGGGVRIDPWQRLGYEVAGPLLFAFARWIATRAREHGIKRLFFLSRDGYHLEKTFRLCADRWNIGIESVYMYSSRRLLNMARIHGLDEPSMDFLLSPNPRLRVRDALERIGLVAGGHAEEVRRAGLEGLDQIVTTSTGGYDCAATRERMKRLLTSLERQILEIAAEERRKVLEYFDDVGLKPGPVAIVDLGWQASSIRSLQDLLRLRSKDCRLNGYYFATWRYAKPAVDAGCMIDSMFFHLDQPARRAAIIGECVELVEHLFSAPHPTVVSIRKAGDRWEPICGEWETTAEQRRCLERESMAAMEFVRDALECEPALSVHAAPFGYLESVLERVLRYPSRREAELFGSLPHRDSFGGVAPWRYLAKVPPAVEAAVDPGSLRFAYDHSYWKKGFLAQLDPAQRGQLAT